MHKDVHRLSATVKDRLRRCSGIRSATFRMFSRRGKIQDVGDLFTRQVKPFHDFANGSSGIKILVLNGGKIVA